MGEKEWKNMDLWERLENDSELVRKLKVKFLGKFGRRGKVNAFDIENFFREKHGYSLNDSRKVSLRLGGKSFHYEGIMGNTLDFLAKDSSGTLIYRMNVSHSSNYRRV